METDSLQAYQMITGKGITDWNYIYLVRTRVSLLNNGGTITHIYREQNQSADCMARMTPIHSQRCDYIQVANIPIQVRKWMFLESFSIGLAFQIFVGLRVFFLEFIMQISEERRMDHSTWECTILRQMMSQMLTIVKERLIVFFLDRMFRHPNFCHFLIFIAVNKEKSTPPFFTRTKLSTQFRGK